ncbi:MAG: hemerythrin domain-containing protein [Polyangiaceae bacterium]|nr:hemerythrin domain-containing protein [Polyangiaceae bacterium]
MPFDRMLAELFRDEDRAREMASRLMQLAQAAPAETVKERDELVEFVRGPMERHMSYEERAVFPQLSRLGLAPEVQVAEKQHAAIRQAAETLATASDEEVPQIVFDTARLLLHHTNFECDYIYPELTHEAWIELIKETTREGGEPSSSVSTGPVTAA